jgi:O-antigen ligase
MFFIRPLIFLTVLVLIMNQSHFFGDPELGPPTWLVIGRFALLLAYCVGGAVGIFLRTPLRRFAAADIPAILCLGLAFISGEFSIDPSLTFGRAVSVTLLYAATFWTIWSWALRYGEKIILDPLVAAGALIFIVGLLMIPLTAEAWQEDGRFRGCLVNPNTLGLLAALFSPLVLWRFFQRKWWSDAALFVAIWISLILAATRNGLIAALVGTAIVLFWSISRAWLLFGAVAVFGLIGLLIGNLENLSEDSALARLAPTAEVGSAGRTDMWDLGWDLIQQSPIIGHGFGTEDLAFSEGSFREYEGKRFHNSYLGMAYELGYVGVAAFFGPLILLALTQFWRRRGMTELALPHVLLAVLVAGLVSAFFESWIYSVGNALSFPFWTCVALLVKMSVDERRSASLQQGPAEEELEYEETGDVQATQPF